MSGANEVYGLAKDLGKASTQVAVALYEVYKQSGDAFARDWANNARATSGVHGKHYPDSITAETRVGLGVTVEAGPEFGRAQGGMGRGFELGSRNQPPHFDGLQAMGSAERRLERAADAAIGHLLP